MKKPVIFNRFEGGIATSDKVGIAHSAAAIQAMDFRKSPGQLTVLPGLAKESGIVVTDLAQNAIMVQDGTIYSIGDSGNFYKRTTAGVWTLIANLGVSATFGMDYRKDTDTIYITTATAVSIYGPIAGTPALTVNKYANSYSNYDNSTVAGFNVSAYQTGSTSSYTLGTTIVEGALQQRYFQSDIEALVSGGFRVASKGTGDWTLTLHDGLNNNLGSVTVTNVNIMNGAWNDFTFATPIRIYVAPNSRTYHFHLTSTVADGSIYTNTANCMGDSTAASTGGCDLEIAAERLIQTTNGLHPMARFLQYEVIGNANYLSVWEPISEPPTNAEWQRHRLVFPSEYEVCGLAVFNEYLAIALQKVSTSATSDPQEGLIAWWDGLSILTNPNYFTKIPEGTPQCIHEYRNQIYYYASGAWYRIASPSALPEKVRTMPGSDTEFYGASVPITINPYAATVRRGILLMGYPSTTTSTSIDYAVYSWGSIDRNFPESFGKNYVLSTGTQNYSASNHLTIGMVKNFGDTLLVSWRDTSTYGVDVVNNASAPATTSYWQSLILDAGFPAKEKKAIYIQATFKTLPSDCSFLLQYSVDRAAWQSSTAITAASTATRYGYNVARFDIAPTTNRYREFQAAITVTSGTTTPTFTSVSLVFDDDSEEELI